MSQSSRRVSIADHLWETLETMSREMATPVDALLNQAIAAFARANGYPVAPPAAGLRQPSRAAQASTARARISNTGTVPGAPEGAGPPPLGAARAGALVRGPGAPPSTARKGPPPVLRPAPEAQATIRSAARAVELEDEAGNAWVAEKDRFLIGRGRHCDLMIDSTKISREHAAIVRTPTGFVLEDLGSSNGTWVEKRRIDRLPLEGAGEFFVCTERFRYRVR